MDDSAAYGVPVTLEFGISVSGAELVSDAGHEPEGITTVAS